MLISEWKLEDALEVRYKEGMEEGRAEASVQINQVNAQLDQAQARIAELERQLAEKG